MLSIDPYADVKSIEIRITPPTKRGKVSLRIIRAPNGFHFSQGKVDDALRDIATEIDSKYPGVDYRVVPLSKSKYNFLPERKP